MWAAVEFNIFKGMCLDTALCDQVFLNFTCVTHELNFVCSFVVIWITMLQCESHKILVLPFLIVLLVSPSIVAILLLLFVQNSCICLMTTMLNMVWISLTVNVRIIQGNNPFRSLQLPVCGLAHYASCFTICKTAHDLSL